MDDCNPMCQDQLRSDQGTKLQTLAASAPKMANVVTIK
jgi:hypothetical protein